MIPSADFLGSWTRRKRAQPTIQERPNAPSISPNHLPQPGAKSKATNIQACGMDKQSTKAVEIIGGLMEGSVRREGSRKTRG